MKINSFYQAWGIARGFVLTAIILAFLILTLRSYAYTIEMDYSGPGSEYEASMERYQDEENRQAAERGEDSEKAEQYRDEHGV